MRKSKPKMKYLMVFFALVGGHFVYSGYIYDRGLGTECLYDEDCITRNSFCKGNKICACKIGFQYDPGSDVCFPKEINLKCNEDYDCSALQNARCDAGKCQCKRDYVPSGDRSYCLPSMKLTSICEEDIQCSSVLNRSHCDPISKRCVCDRGYFQDSYRMLCREEKRLHIPCMSLKDCEYFPENVGKVECKASSNSLMRTCECAEGFFEENDMCYSKDGSSRLALSFPAILILVLAKWLV